MVEAALALAGPRSFVGKVCADRWLRGLRTLEGTLHRVPLDSPHIPK